MYYLLFDLFKIKIYNNVIAGWQMNIVFVRHGNDENDKLTKLGKLQAKLVSEDLTYENIAKYIAHQKIERLRRQK